MRRKMMVAGGVAALLLGGAGWWSARADAGGHISGGMGQSVYIWQREWGAEVGAGVRGHGREFELVVPLAAEVRWERGSPVVARPAVDYAALREGAVRVGLAVRIGEAPGRVLENRETEFLARLAAGVVAEARGRGVEPAELQLDYDCATSRLAGYRGLVRAVRGAVAPVPVVITALPAWLSSAEFAPLARDAGGFVLQVHSVDRPRMGDGGAGATLCDTGRALRWVERAGRAGVPFRVALPTYGYLVVYGADGAVRGLVAEQEAAAAPAGCTVCELRAEPGAMAGLVREWLGSRPAAMTGVIWYRMPVEGDRLNWAWPTLERVMRGERPAAALVVRVSRPEPCLAEIAVANEGSADAALPAAVRVRWSGAAAVASDALAGLELEEEAGGLRLARPAGVGTARLGPGESRAIGWVRLDRETEVRADAVP